MVDRVNVDRDQVRAECEALIMAGVSGAVEGPLRYFERVKVAPGWAVAGPVMAEVFADAIQRDAVAAGVVIAGVADVGRLAPSERHGYARLMALGIPAGTRVKGRRIHRAMLRHARTYVKARARGSHDEAGAILSRMGEEQLGQLVFMLWATALQARRAALTDMR
ncbi:hypothetical protein GCM10010411_88090 [Actinomadura fulvescens]|uniref:Uncharacterized protein n=1 Tax=Actinomadura fulvescens TaxID=46160 RepID=A0ABP6D4T4_9ACTN